MYKINQRRLIILVSVLMSLAACTYPFQDIFSPAVTQAPVSNVHRPLVIGHRGAAGLAPENTLAAIQLAIDLGVDAVEFDVHRSADNVLVVIHDEDVSRTTDGQGLVTDLTLDELQALDAGSWFDAEFAGESIPSLRDVFDLVRQSDVLIFIELKDPARYPGIEAQMVDLIAEYGYGDRVHILSFDHNSLARVHDLAPDLALSGLWYLNLPLDGSTFEVVNARFALYQISPESIDRYHAQGVLAMTWTVNETADMTWLIAQGIDGITTNYPDRLLAVLNTR